MSDITNAVIDGCAATMLSGETAVGDFPIEAVRTMRGIADATRVQILSDETPRTSETDSIPGAAMREAIEAMCRTQPITKIVAITISGYAARLLSMRNLSQPILAVSNDARAARCFGLFPGTEGIFVDLTFTRKSTDHIPACLYELWSRGKLEEDDVVLVTSLAYPKSGNRMNLVQTHVVGDLIEVLEWRKPNERSLSAPADHAPGRATQELPDARAGELRSPMPR